MEDEGIEAWNWLEKYLTKTQYSQILEARRKLKSVFNNNVLPHFTDHSISHCDRIAEIILCLVRQNISFESAESLSKDELFILALAILLHDIGMQIPKVHGIETPISELTREELQIIRRNHGEISGRVIRQLIDDKDDILHIGLTEPYVMRRLPHVATLCEHHQSSITYNPEEAAKLGGQKIRIGLLIALLRFADTLDCDSRRVDLTKLNHFSIPLDSILHWLICSYVDAVSIEKGFIEILASFPEPMTGPEVEYLSRLFIEKMHMEYNIAERTLWLNNIGIRLPSGITRTSTDYTYKKQALPPEILKHIKDKLSAKEPFHVIVAPPSKLLGKEVDWMSYWQFIGNPFLDRPVAYGSEKFVETYPFRQILGEVNSILQGTEGELKLVTGARGLGKTTLFQSFAAKFSEHYDIFIIDVADRLVDVNSVAELTHLIFYSIHDELSVKEPTGAREEIIEAARLGNKKIICVDSLDRFPEDKDALVVDFFKGAQHTLAKLREVSVVLFACANRWARFLASDELSYLGYRNQWTLTPFTSEDIAKMLDKRLKGSGQSFDEVFGSGCAAVLRTLSDGNPRQALVHAEAICRLGAQKKLERITPRFIGDQYQKEFDQALEKMLDRLVKSSPDIRKAVNSIYHYYLEMERRNLDLSEGWNHLIELVERGLPPHRIQGAFRTALYHVSQAVKSLKTEQLKSVVLVQLPPIKALFKELKKEGYSVRDFITFYSTNPIAPIREDNDLEVRLKSPLLLGPDVEYFEKARQIFIVTRRSTGPPFQVISNAWDCVENMIYAILLEVKNPDVDAMIAKREEWFVEDRYGVPRYVRGAGRLRAQHAKDLTSIFVEFLKQKGEWMGSLVSLYWIRDARANIVRGRTEHLTQFGARERDLCLRHLDAVYRELSQIYS